MNKGQWLPVSSRQPCRICGKPDWCSQSADGKATICRRIDDGKGLHYIDKSGMDYWIYRKNSGSPRYRPPTVTETPRADAATLNAVYGTLLSLLDLSLEHSSQLRSRGLSTSEISFRGYRTLEADNRYTAAEYLLEQFGSEVCEKIPGLYRERVRKSVAWKLAGANGLLIPVRNASRQIVALKIRSDQPDTPAKYTSLSSSKHAGPGPGAQVHVPLFKGIETGTIRLTEGELKADIATAISGILTVSIPGVACWRLAIPTLKHLNTRTVRLAFDSDAATNPNVARALKHSAEALSEHAFDVEVEVWA